MTQPKDAQTVANPEQRTREALSDTILIVKKLAPLCSNVDDLIGICTLALENDAQLALIMDRLMPTQLLTPRGK